MSKPNLLQISERLYKSEQSWYYEYTGHHFNHKLRITIRRNAYDAQSYARVHRWDGTKWQLVIDAPITECESRVVSYVDMNVTKNLFLIDAKRLLTEAIAIIG